MSVTSARRRVHMLLRNARRRPSNLASLRRTAAVADSAATESRSYSSYRRTPVSSLLFDGSEPSSPGLKVSSNRRDGD